MVLTFLPVLLAGNNRQEMGEHTNGPFSRLAGRFYFGVICVIAVAAPILLVATNGGSG
jgi:hypothetical protein